VTPEGRLRVTSPSAPAPLLAVHADPDAGCLVVADGAGHESRLYLDDAGRLAAAETPLARTLTAGYGAQGDLEALTDGAGRGVRFGHDALGRLTAVEREGGSGFRFAYDH
jgi:YD repeat-containing protein